MIKILEPRRQPVTEFVDERDQEDAGILHAIASTSCGVSQASIAAASIASFVYSTCCLCESNSRTATRSSSDTVTKLPSAVFHWSVVSSGRCPSWIAVCRSDEARSMSFIASLSANQSAS